MPATHTCLARLRRRALAFLLSVIAVTPVAAEQGMTREQAEAIIDELKQIRVELVRLRRLTDTRPPKPKPDQATVSTAGNPSLGRPDAPVTLVEFTDYECPYCRRFSRETLPELKRKYVDKGLLRVVLLDLPLETHARATGAAGGADCAREQGRYWAMHDALFRTNGKLERAVVRRAAERIGLDMAQYDECIVARRYMEGIADDMATAKAAGIRTTPNFVVGATSPDVISGRVIIGARGLSLFEERILEVLKGR